MSLSFGKNVTRIFQQKQSQDAVLKCHRCLQYWKTHFFCFTVYFFLKVGIGTSCKSCLLSGSQYVNVCLLLPVIVTPVSVFDNRGFIEKLV